ncbi:MAG: metalloregulator ArsR/SmtB family transcription factor [Nitrososphaerota archaeon]|jgi:ArsR family transcriptional regulator|nr:metalloregulator ArsR/SmtB family transcription factor [Nitrososphaerota archaeon]
MATPDNQNRFRSTIFYALSDPLRLEIIAYLRDGEKCVCEIVPPLELIQPLVSRHLKILKATGLVKCRKEGTKRMYSIADQRIFEMLDALTSELIKTLAKEAFKSTFC